jgi:WhiB family redox-sensing transcriptional regulator
MAIIDSPVAVRYLLEKARGIASASGAVGKLAWMSVVQGEYEEDWQLQAACRTADPELFFPLEGESSGATETARDICKKCQVIGSCLKLAVETGEDFGIWAGTTENERREQASLMRAAHAVKAELARVRASQS